MRKVLVTGFEPFLNEKINPSEILLDWLKKDFAHQAETLLLPVSFAEAHKNIKSHLQLNSYDVILMLGQAGGRNKVSLERVALNWIETEHPDEEGFKPSRGVIEEGASSALFTSAPVTAWKDALIQKNLPVEISLSAGGYVCNYTYYQVLQWLETNQKPSAACFIHVPYLKEQVTDKAAGTPYMELETMKAVLTEILSQLTAIPK
ncbi:pyroglutamyl-peptidase I [Bdellovibrio sp. HCB117]|uniref:pyroglutamyl-peptidase I family protein n=1 Tax=Bdellovibrio sp. HCB117 TaxID=3394359 RepID=UPI0039B584EA